MIIECISLLKGRLLRMTCSSKDQLAKIFFLLTCHRDNGDTADRCQWVWVRSKSSPSDFSHAPSGLFGPVETRTGRLFLPTGLVNANFVIQSTRNSIIHVTFTFLTFN